MVVVVVRQRCIGHVTLRQTMATVCTVVRMVKDVMQCITKSTKYFNHIRIVTKFSGLLDIVSVVEEIYQMKKWLVRNSVWVGLKGVILEKMVKEELCVGNCCNDNCNVYCMWWIGCM